MLFSLALDQTEINRIIAEASKGSKFYENEKRKDKDLTERIAHILRVRDEVVKDANLGSLPHVQLAQSYFLTCVPEAVERHVDQLVSAAGRPSVCAAH
jgi:hypothetical protein